MYLYLSGLSLRRTAQRLYYCIKRNHVTIWNWIQKYHPIKISSKSNKISEYIVDEILLKVGSEYVWLWVGCYWARKQEYSNTIYIKGKKQTYSLQRFISDLAKVHGKHPVSTDGGTWYPQACRYLKLRHHHIHSSWEKSLIERTIQYVKDRTECFDDCFPCRLRNCKLEHVKNWMNLFIDYHNKELKTD
jgi:putative transposase